VVSGDVQAISTSIEPSSFLWPTASRWTTRKWLSTESGRFHRSLFWSLGAPKGKEANWVPTDPKRKFELMFRAYGPTKEFLDKKWVLADAVRSARLQTGSL